VNGNPAISYYDTFHKHLKYVRATDANGTNWGPVVTVDTIDDVGSYNSLSVINGNPAISYYDATNNSLKFIQATDVNGTAWGSPITLDTGVGAQFTSLGSFNGAAAMAYYAGTSSTGQLKFITQPPPLPAFTIKWIALEP
jgi:hypothetical protein